MLQTLRPKKAQSLLEYMVLIAFLIAAFIVFQKYIVRGFSGRLKGVGDGIADGRQYDPHLTVECKYDYQYTNAWYDKTCFDDTCIDDCYKIGATPAKCKACITACQSAVCSQ